MFESRKLYTKQSLKMKKKLTKQIVQQCFLYSPSTNSIPKCLYSKNVWESVFKKKKKIIEIQNLREKHEYDKIYRENKKRVYF